MFTSYGKPGDWWALGIITYEMCYGVPPFDADTVEEVFFKTCNDPLEWPTDESGGDIISTKAKDFISGLLTKDPIQRLGTNHIDEIKSHPWFRGIDWDHLYEQPMTSFFVPKYKDKTDTSFFIDRKVGEAWDSFFEEGEAAPLDGESSEGSILLDFKPFRNTEELKRKNTKAVKELLRSRPSSPLAKKRASAKRVKRVILSDPRGEVESLASDYGATSSSSMTNSSSSVQSTTLADSASSSSRFSVPSFDNAQQSGNSTKDDQQ